jgi:translation initiation factor 1
MMKKNVNNAVGFEFETYKEELFPEKEITISVNKRNSKKCKTNIYGWGEEYDLSKICSHFKNTYKCSGAVVENKNYGWVIELTGDNKKNIYEFLINEGICCKENIITKGI